MKYSIKFAILSRIVFVFVFMQTQESAIVY